MNIHKYRADYLFNQLLYSHSFIGKVISLPFSFVSIIVVFLILIALFVVLVLVRMIVAFVFSLSEKSVLLELTPPAYTQKTAYTTQQLFSVLHTIGNQQTFIERLIGKKVIFSFEIVSTRTEGIRYIVRTTQTYVHVVEQVLVSYLPQITIHKVNDYASDKKARVIEFTLTKHFAYPLAKQDNLSEHDPIAYITGMMTKLKPNELIAFQIVTSPIKPFEVASISQKILRNEDVLHILDNPLPAWYLEPFIFLATLFRMCSKTVGWIMNDLSLTLQDRLDQRQFVYLSQMAANRLRPARTLSTFEQQAITTIQQKIAQPLFETNIRAYIQVSSKSEETERIRGLTASFSPFTVPGYQSMKQVLSIPYISTKLNSYLFEKRLLALFINNSSSLLSASELSDLYHFPFRQVTQTENIVKMYSRQLPAPLSLKRDTKNFDTIFAKNIYVGQITMIGLTKEERRRHMYMIGATGTGKSTLILSMVNQDLQQGKGLCVIDPHGELAEKILDILPDERKNDLIYINPDDLHFPIGINLMELTPGLSEEDSLREKEFVAESIISLFRKVFGTDVSGNPHRIEYILRNTIHTAFTVEGATLFTIFELLNNPLFQRKVVAKLQDEHLKDFWKYEFGRAGNYQKVKMVSPITARIGRFLFSPAAKRILEQTTSTINFDDILNGKILICNLAKGKLGEDTSQVLGIMILNKLQLAALKRTRLDETRRKDFYLYVDEFQHFATKSFVEMLSESRKYRLNLILAEQSTSQQEDKDLVHIILANVGTIVCFKTANPKDEKLILPQFEPYLTHGEIDNLPAFHFYMKISALHPEEPFSGETIPVVLKRNQEEVNTFINTSRKNWATVYTKKEVNNKIPTMQEINEEVRKAKDDLPDNEQN